MHIGFYLKLVNISFLNRTLGLRKSFLNQTTYVLKNRLYQQSLLNRDSFLNQAFLNRDSTVFVYIEQLGLKIFAYITHPPPMLTEPCNLLISKEIFTLFVAYDWTVKAVTGSWPL